MDALFWGLAGWCGTPWRHWPPPPPPGPDPWWAVKVLGVIGGVGGGWLFHALSSDPMPGIVGAFIGGRVLSDLGGAILPQRRT
jgi:hypothetical protein